MTTTVNIASRRTVGFEAGFGCWKACISLMRDRDLDETTAFCDLVKFVRSTDQPAAVEHQQ